MRARTSTFVKIALACAVIIMIVIIISLQIKLKNLQEEKDRFSSTLEDYRKRVEEMEYDLSLSKEDYIEKYAREVLGYHKYGEIVFQKNESD